MTRVKPSKAKIRSYRFAYPVKAGVKREAKIAPWFLKPWGIRPASKRRPVPEAASEEVL